MAARRAVSRLKAPLSVTESAARRLRELMASQPKPVQGIRLGVRARGCNGLSYTMKYAEGPTKGDETVEEHGVKVFVDPKALFYVIGTTMDYKEDDLTSEFVFNNPNSKAQCGCGESFTV